MTQAHDSKAAGMRAAWIAALVAVLVYALASFLSSRSTLFDRDEPRFAQAAVEMLDSRNWLYPTFDRELRADKPILVYWLMAGAVKVFGATAWTARFWSPVCLALACWFVFRIGKRLFDERAGLLAMGLLAIAPLALSEGTIATTDALLLACLTGAFSTFVALLFDGPSLLRHGALVSWTSLALLAKGPVGLAIPVLSVALTMFLMRGERVPKGFQTKHVWMAFGAAALVFLAWAIPANNATHGQYAARGLGHHVVERASDALEGHGGNYFAWLPFYVPVVIAGFLSGMLLLPAACVALADDKAWSRRTRAVLIGWSLPCFVLMTLYATKLAHYVLPMFPALALACAGIVHAAERDQLSDRERGWLASGTWIFGAAALLVAAGLMALPSWLRLDELAVPAIAMAAILVATAIVAMRFHRRNRARRAAYVVIGGLATMWIVGGLSALPVVERTKVSPSIAAQIRARVPEGVRIARWKFVEPSFDYYLGRPPIDDFDDEARFRDWAAGSSPAVLVIARDKLETLRDALPAERYVEIAAAKGFNLAKGESIEVVALSRALDLQTPR